MPEYTCNSCEKSFNSDEALSMHTQAKHPEQQKKPLLTASRKKKIQILAIILGGMGLLAFGLIALFGMGNSSVTLDVNLPPEKIGEIPFGAVHWHPRVTIKIDKKFVPIPANIGISVGKIVDTHLSGTAISPTHTHETDGTIHLENNNPRSKPESLTLGYFFYVWDKPVNSTCIFDFCTDKGELKMYVNGVETSEFGNYIMKDKDEIRIEYTSKVNEDAV